MAKDTYYFSHDCNARNDDKIIKLRIKHGAGGYGVFFMIIEKLRMAPDYKLKKDYNIIAYDLQVDVNLIKAVVEDFGLFKFTEDGGEFYSESLCERMLIMENKTKKKIRAGKKGAKKRWSGGTDNQEVNSSAIAVPYQCYADAMTNINIKDKYKDIKKETTLKSSKEKKISLPPPEKNNYENVKNLWNSICIDLPKVKNISTSRKEKIKLRLEENLSKEKDWAEKEKFLKEVFTKMQESDFLRGKNKKGWTATFDWLFSNDRNILKVLEGNYDNRKIFANQQLNINDIWLKKQDKIMN